MATSRTGTTKYKHNRHKLMTWGQNHQEACPHCGTTLNYTTPRQPNSAEADHIIPHSAGGDDSLENLQIICRACNNKKGGLRRNHKPKTAQIKTRQLTATDWRNTAHTKQKQKHSTHRKEAANSTG